MASAAPIRAAAPASPASPTGSARSTARSPSTARPVRARSCARSSRSDSRRLPWTGMHVEIWSDIACPWCYVGKRRFEAALEAFEHSDDVTVTWRSFELDPGAPAERTGERAAHLAAKYGVSVEEARAMEDRMVRAYLTEGELISDHDTLTRLAVEVGLPEAETRELLASDRYAAEVEQEERLGAALGITAVPFFVVDRAIGAAGAQPADVLVGLLDQGWAQRAPISVVSG